MFIDVNNLKRIVIKIGSNVLTDDKGLRKEFVGHLAGQILFLKKKGIAPIIVSSGAIASAMSVLKAAKKPVTIREKQAYAAIGQPILMNTYAREFHKKKLQVAQILITQDGLDNRERFLNAKHALDELIKNGVVPIINENDTVTVNEIKIGDNDQLSAHVAHLVDADLLLILSHVAGLYDRDPKKNRDAQIVTLVEKIDYKIQSMIFAAHDERSVGGMATKLIAARICMDYGIPVFITSGFQKDFVKKMFGGELVGTHFRPSQKSLSARKHWIGNVSKAKGGVRVDSGAQKAIVQGKKSLLPSGIVMVSGDFTVGDCIEICGQDGAGLGKGLASYSRAEVEKIMGKKSSEIEKILGYKYGDEVVHRDDLVLNT